MPNIWVFVDLDDKLSLEAIKGRDLQLKLEQTEKELTEERSDHGGLHAAVVSMLDDLGMGEATETSSLVTRATDIPGRVQQQVRGTVRKAFGIGVHQTFAVIHSHYETLGWDLLGEGFAPVENRGVLDEIEKEMLPVVTSLAERLAPTPWPSFSFSACWTKNIVFEQFVVSVGYFKLVL